MRTSALQSGDYHSYYQQYIDTLGDVDLMTMMRNQKKNFPQFIKAIDKEKWNYAYALGKWTVAEVLLHVIDAERVFQYRALRIGRKDKTPLPGFDQDAYVPESGAKKRTVKSILDEYDAVRSASVSLFASFDEEVLRRVGTASNASISVGALGFLICGHQKHHRNVLRQHYL